MLRQLSRNILDQEEGDSGVFGQQLQQEQQQRCSSPPASPQRQQLSQQQQQQQWRLLHEQQLQAEEDALAAQLAMCGLGMTALPDDGLDESMMDA